MTEAERAEQITNALQAMSGLAGSYAPYLQLLTGNAGFIASFGDLAEKSKNGTLTKNDVLDVIQDAATIIAGVGVLTGTVAVAGWVTPIIGTINYLDRNDWDFDKVTKDIEGIANSIGFNTNTDDLYRDLVDEYGDIFDDLPPILKIPSVSTNEDFRSPLVLDLNNDGITSLNLDESSVYFDLDNNNFKEQTAWISPQDGLLMYDRNGKFAYSNLNQISKFKYVNLNKTTNLIKFAA